MNAELDDAFWNDLLIRIGEGEVVPVVGPGAVTFGLGNELLYPWLAQRLPTELDPPLTFEQPPRDLQEVVDAQRGKGQRVERIYRQLHKIVEDPGLRPGATLAALGAIEGFHLFISTTFDPLLARAVESASPGGKPEERRGASSLTSPCPDLPLELAKMQKPQQRFVYQILGCAQPYRDFVVWDDDVFRFLLRLDQQLPLLFKLSEALQKSHFLVLGLSFADWLLRFFVQVVKHQPLSELAGTEPFIFEKLEPTERDKVVIYFSRLTKQIRVFPADPLDFIGQLFDRWRQKHPAPAGDDYLMNKAHREKHRAPCCIFVSYVGADLEIARYIVSQLQNAGLLVWFNKEQITIGEDWPEALREAVDQTCSLFLSIISNNSAKGFDNYALFERNVASKRLERLPETATFYLPLRIDDGEPIVPDNEPRRVKKMQIERKFGGHLDPDFIGQLRDLQNKCRLARGLPRLEAAG
jgi:hypothetical protein